MKNMKRELFHIRQDEMISTGAQEKHFSFNPRLSVDWVTTVTHDSPVPPPHLPLRYGTLLELGDKRKDMLEKSCKKFMLFREANELQQWINEKEGALTNEEMGSDLEQVEVLQKKFDDFQKVLSSPQLAWSLNKGGGTNKLTKSGSNNFRRMEKHAVNQYQTEAYGHRFYKQGMRFCESGA